MIRLTIDVNVHELCTLTVGSFGGNGTFLQK